MRVLLATDRPQLSDALSLFLSEHGVDVVCVATDVQEMISLTAATHPDAVLVDSQLTGAGSAGAVADFKRTGEPAPVVIMSTATGLPLARMADGDAHVTVGDPPEALLQVLRDVVPSST